MFQGIWDGHAVSDPGDSLFLSHLDRENGRLLGRPAAILSGNPESIIVTVDNAISSAQRRLRTTKTDMPLRNGLRACTCAAGVRMLGVGEPGQGIAREAP